MFELPQITRQCGECNRCCDLIAVESLGKPDSIACQHLCKDGCGIYENRPKDCRHYACAWLQGHLRIEQRPDKVGVVISPYADQITVHLDKGIALNEKNRAMARRVPLLYGDDIPIVYLHYEHKRQCPFEINARYRTQHGQEIEQLGIGHDTPLLRIDRGEYVHKDLPKANPQ